MLPSTLDQLQSAGYIFKDTGPCRACGVSMAWFITPKGKWMPFSRKGDEIPKLFESHHAVCPKREEFRRNKKQ